MTVERMSVSLDAELAAAVRQVAESEGHFVSARLADAARRRVAARGLSDGVAEREDEHGAFTDAAVRACHHQPRPGIELSRAAPHPRFIHHENRDIVSLSSW